jgi:hypothetical protein
MNETTPLPSSQKKRRWLPRFSLRMLLVVMTMLGIALGYAGNFWRRLHQQRQVVAKIQAAGGSVRYNYEFGKGTELDARLEFEFEDFSSTSLETNSDGLRERTRVTREGTFHDVETPAGPKLIRKWLGHDAFAYVEQVSFFRPGYQATEEFDPQLLLQLPQLKSVCLDEGEVNDRSLRSVAQVPELREVVLLGGGESAVTRDGLASLHSAKHLQALSLSGAWINDDILAAVSDFKQLRSLGVMSSPHATSALFSHCQDMTDLRELTIRRAEKIDDEGTEYLQRLSNLRSLWLTQTSISDHTLAHVTGLTKLETLHLGQTNVGDPGMEYVASLPILKRLVLSNTLVTDAGLPSLSRLPALRYLSLGGTKITDAGMPAIARMTQLKHLYLWPTPVTDKGLIHLQSLKNLKQLWIGPHITKEAANELRKALPDCKIYRVDETGSSSFPDI